MHAQKVRDMFDKGQKGRAGHWVRMALHVARTRNKHLSLNPKTIGCMCMGVCVGEIGVGFTDKTILKSRDPMKPQTTYELGVHGPGGQNE
jgi:hypothetical protein